MNTNTAHIALDDVEHSVEKIRREINKGITQEDGLLILGLFRELETSVRVASDELLSGLFEDKEGEKIN